ncbi:murein biosynthesis integral membrane protein MurJ [Clostridium sp. SM-530-WT-3G]|uniref:murein biosynthesis integral membrane protein MurJ n=1 Tax=Clostridium sp. SM-530-WT-3G TaxID=2725303 RepID=UPI00145ED179|nr:murein biosynthesis integral membrane protein MurJ [Clostridium sp. SM-530-WT-3G]NME82399.1 murein biosynthesis integral membrane protein MurJ [Clostridium sp. SM-530-WT-3G]
MKKQSSLLKSTVIIMVVSLISKLLGFVRDMLIANNFGAGMYTDAYNIAVTIPETIFTLIGLAISTAFLPMLSRVQANKGRKEMYNFANNVINILFIISLIFFAVSSIYSREIVSIVANGLSGEAFDIAVRLTRITLINLLFLSINACFTSILQVDEDFIIPSILGLFFNLPMIVYLLLFRNYDIVGLTIANVIGNLFRVIVQIPCLINNGYKYKLFIFLRDERLKEIGILILPVIVGAGANSLNMIVDKNIASSLSQGSISALDYGQKLILFINTIITTSILNVAYPVMANMRSSGNDDGFIHTLKKTISYLALLLIPVTVGAIILGKDIVKIVYGRGQFNEYAIQMTTLAFVGYGAGIFFTGIRDVLNSTLFSMGKTKTTAINGIIGVIINIILSITLSKYLGILGIAISSSIAMAVTSLLLLRSIRKLERNFTIKDIIKSIIMILISSIIMGSGIILLMLLINCTLPSIITLVIGTGTGCIIYFVLCRLLKIQEIVEFEQILIKKIFKKA